MLLLLDVVSSRIVLSQFLYVLLVSAFRFLSPPLLLPDCDGSFILVHT